MTYVLIVLFFNNGGGFTQEFNNHHQCNVNAKYLHSLSNVQVAYCTPKG